MLPDEGDGRDDVKRKGMHVRADKSKRGLKLRRTTAAPIKASTPLQSLGIVVLSCVLFIVWLAALVIVAKLLAG